MLFFIVNGGQGRWRTYSSNLSYTANGSVYGAQTDAQAIHSAILDVNRDFHMQISYGRAHRRVDQLRDRFYRFQWVKNHPDVTWNHDERRLTADDQVWNVIARENLMARCYQNAYEPKWEKLCEFFDYDENIDIPVPDE
ncbi:UNVERIFIED_CONTAM: hypothetical protein Sindi_0661600 [Sesamum indicum]